MLVWVGESFIDIPSEDDDTAHYPDDPPPWWLWVLAWLFAIVVILSWFLL